jgi:hypothetical protein
MQLKASSDENEIGNMIPNVKSLPAYNESKVSQTAVANGILAQITPREEFPELRLLFN